MGIELGSNFTETAALPLDDRYVFATIVARDALIAGRRYEGMLVYVQETEIIYTLDPDLTTWHTLKCFAIVGTATPSPAITGMIWLDTN